MDGGDLSVMGRPGSPSRPRTCGRRSTTRTASTSRDNTPNAEGRYRARFYFDPNDFDPGEASSHFRVRVFIAQDATNLRVITLVLKRQGGQYSIEGRARRNDGTRADTGFFPITNAPHFVEFDWQRATGPGTQDDISPCSSTT